MSVKYRYLTKKFFQVHIIQLPFLISYMNNSLSLELSSIMTIFTCFYVCVVSFRKRIHGGSFMGLTTLKKHLKSL